MTRKIWILIVVLALVLFALAAQVFASAGRTNPPAQNHVTWNSPQTQALFSRACADCHSNETQWPWYSKVPPMSVLVIHNVSEGRDTFNISAPDMGKASDAAEAVTEGKMPPKDYQLMHPQASLSPTERQTLAQGLQKTFGGELGAKEKGGRGGDND